MSGSRLVSKPFVAVTAATGAFFVYVGHARARSCRRFIEDELGAGELGVGLSLSTFAFAAIFARPVIGRLVERYGRRRVMVGGSLLAGVAGFLCATVDALPALLALRGLAGIGEAALFVGAATLVADLAPPHRRAEAASYFSVAVFGGLGVGPIIGEAVLGDDRFHLAFLVAAAFTVLAAVLSLAVPHSVRAGGRRRRSSTTDCTPLIAGSAASSTLRLSGRASSWRPASPPSRRSRRSCPTTPARSASAGRAPCSPPTASSASCCASSAPACPSASAPAAP